MDSDLGLWLTLKTGPNSSSSGTDSGDFMNKGSDISLTFNGYQLIIEKDDDDGDEWWP